MSSAENKKPTFLIAGVQKAGTTTLHSLLSRYPEIFMASRKELHLFSAGSVTQRRFSNYMDWFAGASHEQARGEASPNYSYIPGALDLARSWLGRQTRIVLSIRHPVRRAYSHFWHEIMMGCEYLPFRLAIRRCEWERRDIFYHRHHSYIDRGLYTIQIDRARALFGSSNVLVIRLEDLQIDPAQTVNRVARFVAPHAALLSRAQLGEAPGNPARIPRRMWPYHLFGRINGLLRRNVAPRRLLDTNHGVGRYPAISSDDARHARDLLLARDPGLITYYPELSEDCP